MAEMQFPAGQNVKSLKALDYPQASALSCAILQLTIMMPAECHNKYMYVCMCLADDSLWRPN